MATPTIEATPKGSTPKPRRLNMTIMPTKRQTSPETLTQVATWPSSYKPSMFLLPKSVRDRRAIHRLLRAVSAALIVVVLLVVAGALFLGHLIGAQRQNLSLAQSTGASLQHSITVLGPVDQYYKGYVQRESGVAGTLQSDVNYGLVMQALLSTIPPGTTITSFSTSYGKKCAGPSPFTSKPGIGCINVVGSTPSVPTLTQMIDRMKASPVLTDPFVSSVLIGTNNNSSFTATVNFDASAYSNKYASIAPKGLNIPKAPLNFPNAG